MSYLADTNVVSELRKGERCNRGVATWFAATPDSDLFLSVLNIGELRRGIEAIRRRDKAGALRLERWLRSIIAEFGDRILGVDQAVAEEWGRLNVPDPLPVVDGLLAATAKVHGLTLATRNIKDVARTGADCFNPFAE